MSVALMAREIRKISAIVAFSREKRDIARTHFQDGVWIHAACYRKQNALVGFKVKQETMHK
jgi:hypothetical protein